MSKFLGSQSSSLAVIAAVGVAATVATVYAGKKLLPVLLPNEGKFKEAMVFDETLHGGLLVGHVLKNHGVKFLFTLSGGHISPILVGAKELGIRVVDVRHEVTAVFAADAVSRVSGVPGVACVTAGPGLTNTITAVKNAQMAQSALILLGGATSDLLKGRGSLQDIDQQALLRPHVKWMAHISCVEDIVPMLEQAFHIAQSGTPGPVFLEFPVDTLYPEKIAREWYSKQTGKQTTIRGRVVSYFITRHINKIFQVSGKKVNLHTPIPLDFPVASKSQVLRVAEALRLARKPVLIVGSQAMALPHQGGEHNCFSLQAAVLSLNMPTYTSGMARGLLGKTSPSGLKHNRSFALRNADVVILAGVVSDFRLDYGKSISSRAYLIGVNRDKDDLHKNRSPNYAILSDAATFLDMLAGVLPAATPSQWNGWVSELKEMDKKRDDEIARQAQIVVKPMNPMKVCQAVESVMSENSLIIADGGDFVGTASYILKPRHPLSWLDPGAFGTLGVGGGFALGAQLCQPESEVWIIFGDGACGYSLSEFDTYVRHNIPVIAVVGNDAAWQQILRGQVEVFNDDVACALEYTNYNEVVKGFGAEGIKVEDEEGLIPALQKAKEFARQGKPVLVNCLIGKTDFRKDSIAI